MMLPFDLMLYSLSLSLKKKKKAGKWNQERIFFFSFSSYSEKIFSFEGFFELIWWNSYSKNLKPKNWGLFFSLYICLFDFFSRNELQLIKTWRSNKTILLFYWLEKKKKCTFLFKIFNWARRGFMLDDRKLN